MVEIRINFNFYAVMTFLEYF